MSFWPPPAEPVTVDVERPQYDSRGNRSSITFTLQAVVSVQAAMSRPRLGDGQENRFIQDAAIYIQRTATAPDGSAGLRAGDEVTYNDESFTVAGDARGNQLHPLTGTDFGWMGFRMQGVG